MRVGQTIMLLSFAKHVPYGRHKLILCVRESFDAIYSNRSHTYRR